MAWHATLALADLQDGVPRAVAVGEELALLLRRGDGVHVVQGLCPHKFGLLADGRVEGPYVTCPVHAATFDVRDGRAQPGGVWGGSLRVYGVRVREGVIEVNLEGAA